MRAALTVEAYAQEANAVLLSVLAAGATWFAPLPEAVMTAQAIQQIFGLPVGVAAICAASLELIGVSANTAYLDAQAFNEAQRAYMLKRGTNNPRYPLESTAWALGLVLGFYTTTGAIVAATAIYDVLAHDAPLICLLACLFPVASGIGAMVANRRAAFTRKVARIAEETTAAKSGKPVVVSEQPVVAGGTPVVAEDAPLVATSKPVVASGKPVAKSGAPVVTPQPITLAEYRALVATLGDNKPQDGKAVNQWLQENGYEIKPPTTANRWAKE